MKWKKELTHANKKTVHVEVFEKEKESLIPAFSIWRRRRRTFSRFLDELGDLESAAAWGLSAGGWNKSKSGHEM